MKSKLLGLWLISLTGLVSSNLLAREFSPNVYDCEAQDFSLTYSEATWDGQPLWVMREKNLVADKQKYKGKENIKVMEGIFGLMVSVEDTAYLGNEQVFFTLLVPKIRLKQFDQIVHFNTVLVQSVLKTKAPSFAPAYVKENSYTALKCRAIHHVE